MSGAAEWPIPRDGQLMARLGVRASYTLGPERTDAIGSCVWLSEETRPIVWISRRPWMAPSGVRTVLSRER
jgi:hypothetical protein